MVTMEVKKNPLGRSLWVLVAPDLPIDWRHSVEARGTHASTAALHLGVELGSKIEDPDYRRIAYEVEGFGR
jgi:hypothetical protein